MIINNIKYSLNDISIIPSELSSIKSRSECKPYYFENNKKVLPLFASPMSTVVDEINMDMFIKNGITPILPRNIDLKIRLKFLSDGYWVAFGLNEIQQLIISDKIRYIDNPHILIDIANGHMSYLYEVTKNIKEQNLKAKLMIGNIANPETYKYCCELNIDYVRIGIGGGSGCLTASNTGIFYPIASLIDDCHYIQKKYKYNSTTKMIVDGGIKNYSDIIKSLALGADYVMCGGLFARMLETPGECILSQTKHSKFVDNGCKFMKINQYDFDLKSLKEGEVISKEFYGMSTKRAQKEFKSPHIKTSEGKTERINIEYTMSQWVENFTDYIKSTMSYTGKRNLFDFIGNVETINITNNALNSFNK